MELNCSHGQFFGLHPNSKLAHALPPSYSRFSGGRIDRLSGSDGIPASVDPATGVASKCVSILPIPGISVRLFRPLLSVSPPKLPVLVFYLGGSFLTDSTFTPPHLPYLSSLAAKSGIIVVSVHHRPASERPLPAALIDSWAALNWLVSHSVGGGEAWLAEHGDFARMFLSGEGAGAYIAYNVAS